MIADKRQNRDHKPEPGGFAPGPSGLLESHGFTLVELLVVTTVIGLLAVLIVSGARGMFGKAQMVECLSNMRQMGVAVQLFAQENGGQLPGTSHAVSWTNSLTAYLGSNFIGRCPAVPQHRARVTYAWNDCLVTNGVGLSVASCSAPSLTMAMAELALDQSSEHLHFSGVRGGASHLTPNQFKDAVNVEAHGTSANYLFVDGHAENLAWTEVQLRLTRTNTTFIVP